LRVVNPQANLFDSSVKDSQTQIVYTGEQKAELDKLVDDYFEPDRLQGEKRRFMIKLNVSFMKTFSPFLKVRKLNLDNRISTAEVECADAGIQV
jgi:hypothetical protein